MSIIMLMFVGVIFFLAFLFFLLMFIDAIKLRLLRNKFKKKGDPTNPRKIEVKKEPSVLELQHRLKELEEELENENKYIPEKDN